MLISHTSITARISDLFKRVDYAKDIRYLKRYIPHKHIRWTGSGREALRQILLQSDSKNVGIQAFTCHVVLDAIKAAGCKPVFYGSGAVAEIDEIEKIIKKIDALVVPYNFGFLPEIDKIAALCKKHNVIFIEDCAAALGAEYKGKLAGTFGDYAFYSFGISKCIGFVGGLVASDKQLKLEKYGLKPFPALSLAKTMIEVMIAPIFFNPYIYPLARHLLDFELDKHKSQKLIIPKSMKVNFFESYSMPKFGIKVVLNQFKRYGKIMQIRKDNAELLMGRYGKYSIITPKKSSQPSWLYFVICSDNRAKLIKSLSSKDRIEFSYMRTYADLSGNSKKATKEQNRHM